MRDVAKCPLTEKSYATKHLQVKQLLRTWNTLYWKMIYDYSFITALDYIITGNDIQRLSFASSTTEESAWVVEMTFRGFHLHPQQLKHFLPAKNNLNFLWKITPERSFSILILSPNHHMEIIHEKLWKNRMILCFSLL